MKKIITVLLLLSAVSIQAQWNPISTGKSYYYFGTEAWGRDTVFVTGYELSTGNGHVVTSFNGGSTWTDQTLPASMPHLYTICFPDRNNGFVAGQNGKMIKTNNLGTTWFNLSTGISSQITDLYFLDKDTGYASAGNGTILKTTDGGVNWNSLNTGTTMIIHSVCFPTPQTGYAVAYSNPVNGGIILKSSDYGNSWIQQTSPVFGTLTIRGQKIRFANQDSGMIVGLSGAMLYTHDGGQNWNVTGSGMTTLNLNDVRFDYAGRASICGNQGTIYKSTDFGVTISNHGSITTSADYYSLSYADDSTAYMFGTNGGALKSSSVFPGWEEITEQNALSIYPNPCADQITISAHAPIQAAIVYDLQGRLMLQHQLSAPAKETKIDLGCLPAGVYIIEIVQANGKLRKRIMR